MEQDIDIFADLGGISRDHRWDHDRNAKLLNIIFHGGTFGTFLKFFLDKFSMLSPDIEGDPFTQVGSSHNMGQRKFSGLIQRYHSSFINDNLGKKNLPICIITPSTRKHFLFLKKGQWFKPPSLNNYIAQEMSPDDLFKKAFGDMPEFLQVRAKEIKDLYGLKETAYFSWIPKFIVRDWYKLEFIQDMKCFYQYRWFENLKEHKFFSEQQVFHLDMESFFDSKVFMNNMETLDGRFDIKLDFGKRQQMLDLFERGLKLDPIRQECNKIEMMLDHGFDVDLKGLDVSSEAFIYAHFERKHQDIQMPMTNRFFRDCEEIKQYLEYFPAWYRRKNPNIE